MIQKYESTIDKLIRTFKPSSLKNSSCIPKTAAEVHCAHSLGDQEAQVCLQHMKKLGRVFTNSRSCGVDEEAQVCLQDMKKLGRVFTNSRSCGVDEPLAVLVFPLLGLSLGLSDSQRQSVFLAQIPVRRSNNFIRRSSWSCC